MKNILILGAGKIGCLIATFLQHSKHYKVAIADQHFHHEAKELLTHLPEIVSFNTDISDKNALSPILKSFKADAIISSLPFFLNNQVAQFCLENQLHYFDLTEDTKVTDFIKTISSSKTANSAFIPQCGLAPGFIGLAANSLMNSFDKIENVFLRVGALPQNSNNSLFYSLTWSTEGLINEYLNPCFAIANSEKVSLPALENYELLNLQGERFEAFNTSGGLGSLSELYAGKVVNMNYKTLRYVGHREKIKFLLSDLKLAQNPELLKEIFEHAIPRTHQDVVVIYIAISGLKNGALVEESYFKKIYPAHIVYREWAAIQISTAAGMCAVVDLFFQKKANQTGFIAQEDFSLDDFLQNQFGKVYL